MYTIENSRFFVDIKIEFNTKYRGHFLGFFLGGKNGNDKICPRRLLPGTGLRTDLTFYTNKR